MIERKSSRIESILLKLGTGTVVSVIKDQTGYMATVGQVRGQEPLYEVWDRTIDGALDRVLAVVASRR